MDWIPLETNVTLPEASITVRNVRQFDLFGYCYGDRISIVPQLQASLGDAGGWILERRTISSVALEVRFEIQLVCIQELYGALVGLGIELTRASHAALTELCTCRKHLASAKNPHQVVVLRLEVNFLADVTLHSILMTGSGLA
jgi:hypothetical protein